MIVPKGFLRKMENLHWVERADLESKPQSDGFDTRLPVETLIEFTFRIKISTIKKPLSYESGF
nr:hypothetical protein [Pseudopedobacter sp.]